MLNEHGVKYVEMLFIRRLTAVMMYILNGMSNCIFGLVFCKVGFFFSVLLSIFPLSSIFHHLLSRVQHIFWNQTIVEDDFELELSLHCTKKSLRAGTGEPCPYKDRATWIKRVVGLYTPSPRFFPDWTVLLRTQLRKTDLV